MQTFLTHASFKETAQSLDLQRLGKQRVEAYQVLLQLCGLRMVDYPLWEPRLGGWNHPAMAMWSGHEISLVEYIRAMCEEWAARGHKDSCLEKSEFVLELMKEDSWSKETPLWVGNKDLHETHRSNLLRKDFEFYKTRFPESIPPENNGERTYLEYIWPKTEILMKERKIYNYERALKLAS